MREMMGLTELRRQGRMIWMELENGWVAAPEEILTDIDGQSFVDGSTFSPPRDLYGDEGGEG